MCICLKKILEVSEEELNAYWDKYEQLRNNQPLLGKILGHKEQGIICAYRYASGSISTPEQLFMAVQESIKAALENQNIAYKGENTLKESAILWLQDGAHNSFMNELLKKMNGNHYFLRAQQMKLSILLRKILMYQN